MEATLYRALYRLVTSLCHGPRGKRQQFGDRRVVLVYMWGVIHDRPTCWACDERHWPPAALDGMPLPSASTMSRRLRTLGVRQLVERALAAASDLFPVPMVKLLDSKPLCVGGYTKDRDAKRGRAAGGTMARGYRLHALTHGRGVRHWALAPMNANDAAVAPLLLSRLEGGWGCAVADNAYDANDLHACAAAAGHQLVAPPRACNRGVRDGRYNRPERLRALDLLDPGPAPAARRPASAFGRALYDRREAVESCFGELTMAGLGPLPAWVRRPRRVALWVAGKILLHTLRCALRQRLTALMQ